MKATFAQLTGSSAKTAALMGVLLYGSDVGAIREHATTLVRERCGAADEPFRLCVLAREQHARLLEECTAQSLMGRRRVVRVVDATDALVSPLKRLQGAAEPAFLVVEAPGITARSKLRAFAEAASDWAAVPCYPVTGHALQSEIKRILATDGIRVTDDALQFMATSFGEDQSIRRAQLETLALYVGQGAIVDLESVRTCLAPGLDRDVDDALHAALAGHVEQADAAVASLVSDDISGPGLLASLNYHLVKVLRSRRLVEGGMDRVAATKAAIPPVFFQRQAIFGEGLDLWSSSDLLVALDRVRAADIACKRAGSVDAVIAAQLLTSFARHARGRRRGTAQDRPRSMRT